MITRPAIFKWRQTEPGLIVCAVRWYLRYSLSLRDVEELLEERGSPCRSHNSLEAVKKPRIRIGVNSSAKKIASGCPINVRGSIGIHFPSILKLRKSSQTGFFTASRRLCDRHGDRAPPAAPQHRAARENSEGTTGPHRV